MINVRSSNIFNIKKDELLLYVSQEEIIKKYFGELSYKKNYKSPFRDDEAAGCRFYIKNNKILFRDFSKAINYDCFDIASKQLQINNFQKLLNKIAEDFNVYNIIEHNDVSKIKRVQNVSQSLLSGQEDTKSIIDVKIRDFNKNDFLYWQQFNISEEALLFFKIKCLKYIWIDKKFIWEYSQKDPAYFYPFPDKTCKIYFPLRNKKYIRFLTNSQYIQGLNFLPRFGDNLVITKSYKDVMSYTSFGVNAIAEQSESIILNENIYSDLYNRFDRICINKDYDRSGFISTRNYRKLYFNNDNLFVRHKDAKDFSGLIKIYGVEEAKRWLEKNNLI